MAPAFRPPGILPLVEIEHIVVVENVDHAIDLVVIAAHGDESVAAAHAFRIGAGVTCGTPFVVR